MTIIRAAEMRLSDRDVARAANRFGIRAVERLGGFENALYRSLDPPGRILRITHTSRRSVGMIEGELAFMSYLCTQSVPVAAPVPSLNQDLVEALDTDDGEQVLIACMTEAPGSQKRRSDWTTEEIECYGALLGRMHAAAESFQPPDGARRPSWKDPIFVVGLDSMRETQPDLFLRQQQIASAAAAHWSGADQLLIHQDAHLGNLVIDDGSKITIFDFDDCACSTATHDIAIVLFYWLLGVDENQGDTLRSFIRPFLNGYNRHTSLPTDWPEGCDLFLAHRELDLFWLVSSALEDESSAAELRFMVDRHRRILDGVPYLGAPLFDLI